MYQTVYFHKATRAAEVMLRLLFMRYKELLDNENSRRKRYVVKNVPNAVLKTFTGKANLDDYLLLDDHTINEFLKCCELSDDTILKKL